MVPPCPPCFAIQHTILVMAISCKGQVAGGRIPGMWLELDGTIPLGGGGGAWVPEGYRGAESRGSDLRGIIPLRRQE